MQLILVPFGVLILTHSVISATLSKTNAAQRQQPFFASKTAPARIQQQAQQVQEQEQEAALPNFVEPPAAPAPEPDAGEPMMPYAFEYAASAPDGAQARKETNDGQRVTGTYTLAGPDGINRVVHYVADKDGFRATIVTNEPGTESQSPSGVILNSSQLPAEQIALQYGPKPAPDAPLTVVRFPAPIPAVPAFAPSPIQPLINAPVLISAPLRAAPQSPALTSTTTTTTRLTTSNLPSTAAPSAPARLLAAAGIKGASAPQVQQRLSPVQRGKTSAIKAPPAPLAVKTAPIIQQQLQQEISAPIKAPARPSAPIRSLPPLPTWAQQQPLPAPIQSKTIPRPAQLPARIQSKTAPIKSAQRAPFFITARPPPPPPAPTTEAPVQQSQPLQQELDQQQELEQLQQEPQLQQLNDQQEEQDSAENPQTESTFFA